MIALHAFVHLVNIDKLFGDSSYHLLGTWLCYLYFSSQSCKVVNRIPILATRKLRFVKVNISQGHILSGWEKRAGIQNWI